MAEKNPVIISIRRCIHFTLFTRTTVLNQYHSAVGCLLLYVTPFITFENLETEIAILAREHDHDSFSDDQLIKHLLWGEGSLR